MGGNLRDRFSPEQSIDKSSDSSDSKNNEHPNEAPNKQTGHNEPPKTISKGSVTQKSANGQTTAMNEAKKQFELTPQPNKSGTVLDNKPSSFLDEIVDGVTHSSIGKKLGLATAAAAVVATTSQASTAIEEFFTPSTPKKPQTPSATHKQNNGEYSTSDAVTDATDATAVGFNALTAKQGIHEISAGTSAMELLNDGMKGVKASGGLGKFAMKKLPFVGAALGMKFAADRFNEGDYTGAAMEAASGALSMIPGVGTLASAGIDTALMARDRFDGASPQIAQSSNGLQPVLNSQGQPLGLPQQQPMPVATAEALQTMASGNSVIPPNPTAGMMSSAATNTLFGPTANGVDVNTSLSNQVQSANANIASKNAIEKY